MKAASVHALPEYDAALSDFHRAFEPELAAMLDALPLTPRMRVLDVACGDGFYTRRIAERLGRGGSVTGVDLNLAYLSQARKEAARNTGHAAIKFVAASFDSMPFADDTFDLVWCAQSLYSLPEPRLVLEHLARVVRPGGILAVLENDTMHQVFLPWPVSLELPLRAAELMALTKETRHPSKYYIGRRLPEIIAAAGLQPVEMTTRVVDRQAPLGHAEARLLQAYLDELTARVTPHIEPSLLRELHALVDPQSPEHMLRQPYLTMTWMNVVALGRKRPEVKYSRGSRRRNAAPCGRRAAPAARSILARV